MDETDTRERAWMCVRCGYVMDTAGLAFQNEHTHTAPEEGDLSVCMNCGEPYVRVGERWRQMTAAEFAALDPIERRQIATIQLGSATVITTDLAKRDGGGRA